MANPGSGEDNPDLELNEMLFKTTTDKSRRRRNKPSTPLLFTTTPRPQSYFVEARTTQASEDLPSRTTSNIIQTTKKPVITRRQMSTKFYQVTTDAVAPTVKPSSTSEEQSRITFQKASIFPSKKNKAVLNISLNFMHQIIFIIVLQIVF